LKNADLFYFYLKLVVFKVYSKCVFLCTNVLKTPAFSFKMIQWRSQKFGLRVQPDNFGLKALLILKFCNEKAKTPFYLVLSSLGLDGGANAPLHPLWLRY